jgi:NAD(P)H-dependent FMN reductase
MAETFNLAVIVGSVRQGRQGDAVADWFFALAEKHPAFRSRLVDLADFRLPTDFGETPDLQRWKAELASAQAFVIVTPEYNHGYPAGLKQAIDSAYEEWKAKPIAFVSYGGMGGGLRAVEQLRQVYAELEAVTIRTTVSLHNFHLLLDSSSPGSGLSGSDAAAVEMLDQLQSWMATFRRQPVGVGEPHPETRTAA